MEEAHAHARLTTRPAPPGDIAEPGLYELELGIGSGRDGVLYIPDTDTARPLFVALHGATMHAKQMLRPLLAVADEFELVMLLPDSRGQSWDILQGGYGPDVEFLDRALALTFDRCRIDAGAMSIGGVSDGASYALSLGVTNGDLFSSVVAFSPGFIAPLDVVGQPRVFVSHGVNDPILPIDMCGRPIVAGLKGAGYDVEYVEFDGGHEMPEPVIRSAFRWLTKSSD
jgi:phospholipase/carboxylesterase